MNVSTNVNERPGQTSDRDRLAALVRDVVVGAGGRSTMWESIADAVIEAGWRPPVSGARQSFGEFTEFNPSNEPLSSEWRQG